MTQKQEVPEQASGFWRLLKKYFLSGIAIIFPVFVTVYLIVLLFQFINSLAGKHINTFLWHYYGYKIPGLGFLVTVLLILAAGFLSSHFLGRWMLPFFERVFLRIPLVNSIYPSAKQLSGFLFDAKKRERFKKVVIVEFPLEGSYSIGFITNEGMKEFQDEGKDFVSVFIPLAPAPFSGFIVLLPREKTREFNISIDRAIKIIVSGGVVWDDEERKEI